MIHPSSLLRTHSNAEEFSAPRNVNLGLNNFDCGLKAVPWLTPLLKLEKYAKTSVFVFIFCFLGLLQGILQTYFQANSQHLHISANVIDWILTFPNISIGIFGIFIVYYGNHIHRPTWLGSLAIFQAISAWTLIIPENYLPPCRDQDYCTETFTCAEKLMNETVVEKSYITTTFLFTYQLFYSFSLISYFTFGITYIDDHIKVRYTPVYLCVELLCWKMGEYFGLFLSIIPIQLKRNVFFSFVWLTGATLLFIVGSLICLFPKLLPSKIERNGVDSLLHVRNHKKHSTKDGLWQVIKRLLQNYTLLQLILIAILAGIASTNFDLVKNDYFQSNFFIPTKSFMSFKDPISMQYLFNFFMQPIICFGLMITGLFIIKLKPTARTLVIYLIIMYILLTISFITLVFLKCEDKIYMKFGSFSQFCNSKCHCNEDIFSPVCLQKKTYYSPCFAGCRDNDLSSCSCAPGKATLGSCNYKKCSAIWVLAQINEVFRGGVFYSILLIQLFLCLRIVGEKDKPIALALYFVATYFFPVMPFKIILDVIKPYLCLQKNGSQNCLIYNRKFVILITSSAAILTCLAAILSLVLCFTKAKIEMYKNKKIKEFSETRVDVIYEDDEEQEASSLLQTPNTTQNTSALNEARKIFSADEEVENSTNSKSDVGYSDEDINRELRFQEYHENKTNNERLIETQF